MADGSIAPTQALVPVSRTHDLALLDDTLLTEDEIASTIRYGRNSKARNTLAAYASDWRQWLAWAAQKGLEPLPISPGLLCAYLSALADRGLSASSIEQHRAAVGHFHRVNGYKSPCRDDAVIETMRGIRHTIGTAKRRQKMPLTADLILRLLNVCPDNATGIRDRAMISLGFAAALRRSELIALDVEDLIEVADGYRLIIRRSKTDQSGEGQEIAVLRGVYLKPVEAVQRWLDISGNSSGALFRTVSRWGQIGTARVHDDTYVGHIKAYAEQIGLDPAVVSGHSCRSGFCTSAAESGADVLKMAEVTRHRDLNTLRHYVRRANLFREHAGSGFI